VSAVLEPDNQSDKNVSRYSRFGNRNAAKGKEWMGAVKWALKRYESNSIKRGQALRAIAIKLVEDALAGKADAWREISERLDGKVGSGDSAGSIKVLVIRDQSPGPIPIEAEVRRLDGASG
jgi:hypothetical protein